MTKNAPRLAATLHDQFCCSTSWETPQGRASHIKRSWIARAKEILRADDPGKALHDTIACAAVADPNFPDGCGNDRARHLRACRDWLTLNGFLPGPPTPADADDRSDHSQPDPVMVKRVG